MPRAFSIPRRLNPVGNSAKSVFADRCSLSSEIGLVWVEAGNPS
jgi:hypothetical protein